MLHLSAAAFSLAMLALAVALLARAVLREKAKIREALAGRRHIVRRPSALGIMAGDDPRPVPLPQDQELVEEAIRALRRAGLYR
jgi:hypothetical protein